MKLVFKRWLYRVYIQCSFPFYSLYTVQTLRERFSHYSFFHFLKAQMTKWIKICWWSKHYSHFLISHLKFLRHWLKQPLPQSIFILIEQIGPGFKGPTAGRYSLYWSHDTWAPPSPPVLLHKVTTSFQWVHTWGWVHMQVFFNSPLATKG